jgi:hypothetical protein
MYPPIGPEQGPFSISDLHGGRIMKQHFNRVTESSNPHWMGKMVHLPGLTRSPDALPKVSKTVLARTKS